VTDLCADGVEVSGEAPQSTGVVVELVSRATGATAGSPPRAERSWSSGCSRPGACCLPQPDQIYFRVDGRALKMLVSQHLADVDQRGAPRAAAGWRARDADGVPGRARRQLCGTRPERQIAPRAPRSVASEHARSETHGDCRGGHAASGMWRSTKSARAAGSDVRDAQGKRVLPRRAVHRRARPFSSWRTPPQIATHTRSRRTARLRRPRHLRLLQSPRLVRRIEIK
jgi:hypothetical protein